jgi:hypothetical protein
MVSRVHMLAQAKVAAEKRCRDLEMQMDAQRQKHETEARG